MRIINLNQEIKDPRIKLNTITYKNVFLIVKFI